ncbi:unnamed protein product [Arctia plantaginis]|uniref:Uncharacterized protein n=1 Tax=Arctia plantaginis TaxID=874455 RepID=A0A8S1B3N9_ARCPL|nr:unnamed protein product [Arctia plantaginis]
MGFIHGILLILFFEMASSLSNIRQHSAAIEAVPPRVSLTPIEDKQSSKEMINIDPFLTTTLLQAAAMENDSNFMRNYAKRNKIRRMLFKEGFLLV